MPAAKSDKTPSDKDKRDLKSEIENSAKLFDVAKPGETPAGATSRPIIVGHASMIKDDPMMKDKSGDIGNNQDETMAAKTHRVKELKPLGATNAAESKRIEPEKDETLAEDSAINVKVLTEKRNGAAEPQNAPEEPQSQPEEKEEPVVEQASDESQSEPEAETAGEEPVAEEEPSSEILDESQPEAEEKQTPESSSPPDAEKDKDTGPGQGVVDSLVNEANAKKENQKKEDESVARAEEAEKLIESKQYFVPIGQVSRRRSNHRIVLGLFVILLLAATAVNFAVDAEVVDIGVDALTDVL